MFVAWLRELTLAILPWAGGCCGASAAWRRRPAAWRPSFPSWAATDQPRAAFRGPAQRRPGLLRGGRQAGGRRVEDVAFDGPPARSRAGGGSAIACRRPAIWPNRSAVLAMLVVIAVVRPALDSQLEFRRLAIARALEVRALGRRGQDSRRDARQHGRAGGRQRRNRRRDREPRRASRIGTLFVAAAREKEAESPLAMVADEERSSYRLTVPSVLKPLCVPPGDRRFADAGLRRRGARKAGRSRPSRSRSIIRPIWAARTKPFVQKSLDLEAPQYTVAELRLRPSVPVAKGYLESDGERFVGRVEEGGKLLVARCPC